MRNGPVRGTLLIIIAHIGVKLHLFCKSFLGFLKKWLKNRGNGKNCSKKRVSASGKTPETEFWEEPMSIKYRICACALLALTAVLCASFTVADLRDTEPTASRAPTAAPSRRAESAGDYILLARDGCVAVIDPEVGGNAVVTDIELSTLRDTDRQMIEAGLKVSTRDELLSLLEDLGS